MGTNEAFVRWFQQATGDTPFPFQARFAGGETLPQLVHVPTGLGKTAMAVLGWLWRCHSIPYLSRSSAAQINWSWSKR